MKCRICGKDANISLKAYNIGLCAEDFISFFEKQVVHTIRKYTLIDKIDIPLVAVSGGKDSLSLWHLLNTYGYASDGLYIDLGIGDYSALSFQKSKQMADRLGRKLYRFSLANTFEKGIQELSRTVKRQPCSLCGLLKRYVMNKTCVEEGYTVLATGHNLDDEASALLGNLLYWKKEYLWKKDIVLKARRRLAKKIKPFFLRGEKEVAAYAVLNGIDYIYEECPYSLRAKTLFYKGLLNSVEEVSPATKIRFVKGYLEMIRDEEPKDDVSYCNRCGYPSYSETCNFCRFLEKYGTPREKYLEVYEPCA
jgi:tRNA-5-methyluridine54 2-sulfurtransferase